MWPFKRSRLESNQRLRLTPTEADRIHRLILESDEETLKAQYLTVVTATATNAKFGIATTLDWNGTQLSEAFKRKLDEAFGIDYLRERNLLHNLDGRECLELRILAEALPGQTRNNYFSFDPKAKAAEEGIDWPTVERTIKASLFKGTIGRPGRDGFGILVDEEFLRQHPAYKRILGIGFRETPVHPLGIGERSLDTASVYVLWPDKAPLAVELIAGIVNFPGASEYRSAGKSV